MYHQQRKIKTHLRFKLSVSHELKCICKTIPLSILQICQSVIICSVPFKIQYWKWKRFMSMVAKSEHEFSHYHFSCEDVDSITVRVKINGENKDIGVYCGKKRPPMLMSSGNDMEMYFTSKTNSNTKGFKATYKFVEGKRKIMWLKHEWMIKLAPINDMDMYGTGLLDSLPAPLLKQCLVALLSVITQMLNLSLSIS